MTIKVDIHRAKTLRAEWNPFGGFSTLTVFVSNGEEEFKMHSYFHRPGHMALASSLCDAINNAQDEFDKAQAERDLEMAHEEDCA